MENYVLSFNHCTYSTNKQIVIDFYVIETFFFLLQPSPTWNLRNVIWNMKKYIQEMLVNLYFETVIVCKLTTNSNTLFNILKSSAAIKRKIQKQLKKNK